MAIKQRLKLGIKRILLGILMKLDGTLHDNISQKKRTVSYSNLNNEHSADLLPSLSKEEPTIVFNRDSTILSKAMLLRAICSFFQTQVLDQYQHAYYLHLLKNPHYTNTYEVLEQLYIGLNTINFPQIPLSVIKNHKAKLSAVMQDAYENKIAYTPDEKQNPQGIWWPDPTYLKFSRSLFTELPWAEQYSFVDRTTPIGSAGSCFAVEIAHRLQKQQFNYVVCENKYEKPLVDASADWGIIFNAPALRQLVEKAFNLRKLPKLLWSAKVNGTLKYFDPFREDVIFDSIHEYEEDYEKHLLACREALLKCKVFVLTVGMNEVWMLRSDGSVFSRSPWNISPEIVLKKVLTVDENILELQKLLDIWRLFNPDIKLILSVSPVPLHATFQAHHSHVITANCLSKSTLKCAVDKFCKSNKDVFYFPSYETVMYCTKKPWADDQRHVSSEAIDNVMALFSKLFLAEELKKENVAVSNELLKV